MSTPLEPVGAEDLEALRELEAVRFNLGLRLLDLEEERVRVLAAARRVKGEQNVLFRRIASERGLGGDALVEINSKTGEVVMMAVDVQEERASGAHVETTAPGQPA